ncbi:MAG TPA: TonB-dependent receptor [Kofleriaceae bacterium]|nr:TonB-dependent receptor [Kofleriaceae bacterium]
MPGFGPLRYALLFVVALEAVAAAQDVAPIDVAGRVIDSRGRPVRGASVTVDGQPAIVPSTTDARGRFQLAGVPTGASLVIAADGFQTGLATASAASLGDVVLLSVQEANEVIEVKGEAPPDSPGAARLDRSEVSRIPGTGNDLVRTLSAMPGVVNSQFPLGFNGIVIRGSAPEDSKLLIDGFEVPALYHDIAFRSIVPTEAIDSLDYLPGGFGVEYGRAASGIVALTTRPGADQATEQVETSSLDAGALAQGKAGKLRYMVAARRSTIDLLIPLILPSSLDLSLTTVPRYYDEQLRLDYALSPRWTLTASSIGSDDLLEIYTDKAQNADKRFYNRTRFARFIFGARYSDGPWTATLAASVMPLEFKFESGAYQFIDVNQIALDTRAEAIHTSKNIAGLTDLVWRVGEQTNISHYDVDLALPPQPREGSPQAGFPNPNDTSNRFDGVAWTPDIGLWSALTAGLSPAIRATLGLRIDAFTRSNDVATQPRADLQIKVTPDTTLRLAAGAYRRPAENQEELEHPDLHPERATQTILGMENEPIAGLRVQTSLYYTDRTNLIIRGDDGVLRNTGVGTTYGAELLGTLRRGPWFVWVSASLSHSVRHDTPTSPERLFEYDQPVSINAAASWRRGKWQLSARFELYSGLPVTPVVGAVFDSDANFYDPIYGKPYTQRAPIHHQLDLRVDRSFMWGPIHMTWFIDVQNVYLNQSTVGYFYSYDYTQRAAFQSLPILPTVGLRGVL